MNEGFASRTEFGKRIVNGIYTMGLVVGLTVGELSEGTLVANLAYDRIIHPNPIFTAIRSMSRAKCSINANQSHVPTVASSDSSTRVASKTAPW